MSNVIVLGAGLVGRTIAKDLSKNHNVTSVDINDTNLNFLAKFPNIKTIKSNLNNADTIKYLVNDYDIVVGAVPGFMGFKTLKAVIEAEKNIIDISFFPEDCFELDELAKVNNVIAIVDCGVAPGMSNLILGYYNKRMAISDFLCYVGGLPFERKLYFQYKAPFSPVDVLEEYTREARYFENGHLVIKPALSDAEIINFEGIGSLEAFNTDGLRSLIKTMNIPNMKEKTLRYPGHIDLIKALKSAGFMSEEVIEINNQFIKPIDFTAKILFNDWKLETSDDEFTVMKIEISGVLNDKKQTITYNLFDRKDFQNDDSSMSRTTGFACTAAVELVLSGKFNRKGISPPEFIGEDEDCFNFMLDYQAERGVKYNKIQN